MNLTFIRNRLMAAVATSLMLAASGALADKDHETKEAWRLFIAAHTQPVVRAIDLESGKELGRYDLKGHAALTASASGRGPTTRWRISSTSPRSRSTSRKSKA